jgi:DNA-binding MarR family transcriptional regulator
MTQDIRAFNRFYTDILGLLDSHLLNSKYSLAEARILYEISQRGSCHAAHIMTVTHMDKSYLSRLIRKLEKEKLISRKRSQEDARSVHLTLTAKGEREFHILNEASEHQIKRLLDPLSIARKEQLVYHMKEIMQILSDKIN